MAKGNILQRMWAAFAKDADPEEALEAAKGDVNDHAVEIGLKQLFLPWMEEKPLMLVVMSEPLDN